MQISEEWIGWYDHMNVRGIIRRRLFPTNGDCVFMNQIIHLKPTYRYRLTDAVDSTSPQEKGHRAHYAVNSHDKHR